MTLLEQATPAEAPETRLPSVLEPMAADLARLEAFLRDDTGVGFALLGQILQSTFASGGKRIRPALVFGVAQLGQADPQAVLYHAAAVETLHAASLVHDDLVDGALLRRGMPTINKRWGAGATVLAGDWLFARSAGFSASTGQVGVVQLFAKTLGDLSGGELRQLFGRRGIPSREEYAYRIYAKTGSLFQTCTEGSALLMGLDPDRVDALARFGRELGMAFQVVDDLLDFTASEAGLGKPVGSDLRSGQVTLPALLHLQAHPEAAPWLRNGASSEAAQVDALIEAIRNDAAALEGAQRAAEAHIEQAVEALRVMPASPARDALEAVARYVVARDR